MSLNIAQIAEAFCSYRFVVTYPYTADEIKWNIVGREELMGREAVIDQCDKSAKFLKTVSATITKLKINRADTFIVVEGPAQFQDQENRTSAWPAVMSFNFRMGDLLRLHHTTLS